MADAPRRRTPNFTKPDGVALKEHFETRLAAQNDYFMARLDALDKATGIASNNLKERLAGMNEFRAAMGDLSGRMMTREEVVLLMKKVDADIADLKKSRDRAEGKASQTSVLISYLIGGAGLVFGIINLLGK
jgi:hypothetical protein